MLDEWATKKRSGYDPNGRSMKQEMSTIEYLDHVTRVYLGSEEQVSQYDDKIPVKENIEGCAQLLVAYRLARERHRSKHANGGA